MGYRIFSVSAGWMVAAAIGIAMAGCAAVDAGPAPAAAMACFEAAQAQRDVAALAAERFGGRMAGTAGAAHAQAFVADRFRALGLQPAGGDGYFQAFELEGVLTGSDRSGLHIGDGPPATMGTDFQTVARGCDGGFDAPVVFAGYGVNNRIRLYDDYERVSASGAVALLLLGEPHDESGQSLWALKGRQTRLAGLEYKLRQAQRQGAVAALLVAPPALSGEPDVLDDVLGDGAGPLPALRISRATADRLLAPAGQSISRLVEQIRRTGQPAGMALGVKASGTAILIEAQGRNVVGRLPPDGPDSGKVVVVAAHLDHLPATGQLARDRGLGVRPGADDNASGVAALLQIAAAMGQTPGRRVTYLFVAFDAEEIGFQGSRHFVAEPPVDLDRIAAMVNLDQVGHVRSRLLLLGSTAAGPVARAIGGARRYAGDVRLAPLPITNGLGWSDQMAFARQGIPTLFAHASLGPAYHSRGDRPETLSDQGIAAAAGAVYQVLRHVEVAVLPRP